MSKELTSMETALFCRIVLDERKNPADVDPFLIINNVFAFCEPRFLKGWFKRFCTASIREDFDWPEGSPGHLLFYFERIETLVEAAFLIHRLPRKEKRKTLSNNTSSLSIRVLPVSLDGNEYVHPARVFDRFFDQQPFLDWKCTLHHWLEAALSNYGIAETESAGTVAQMMEHVPKLIDACARVHGLYNKNN